MANRRGSPQNMRPVQPGEVRNPEGISAYPKRPPKEPSGRGPGRPPGIIAQKRTPASERPAVIMWNLKQAMRALCPEARDVVERCLKSEDERVALLAAQIAFERGYGKPEQHADVNVTHSFAEVPQVMSEAEWLRRRGQPEGPEGDEWLRQRGATPVAAIPQKRTSEAPSAQARHSSGPPTIDLTAEDALLTAVDPTEPPPPGSKLN
jgi:hypothetical protein